MAELINSDVNRTRNFWVWRVSCSLLLALIISLMVFAEFRAQSSEEKNLEERYALRADTTSTFMTASVEQVLEREKQLASLRLGTPSVSHDQFLDYTESMGFGPSMLLDENGILLEIAPLDSSLIGQDMSTKYDHLKVALDGHASVSNTVRSAVQGLPIVAFATPYDSAAGRRIISGAYDLSETSIGDYLNNVTQIKTSETYILDANDAIVASNVGREKTYSKLENKLAKALDSGKKSGHYTDKNGQEAFFSTAQIKGTPWRVVLSVETKHLYSPIGGSTQLLPWLFILAFSAVSIFMLVKLLRDREKRIHLQDTSLVDLLTGVANKRGMISQLNRSIAFARRHEKTPSILYVDLDSFTDYNQKHGHNVGDATLVDVAENIAKCLRAEDYVGRWGADEFIVFLPDTPAAGAEVVATRIIECVTDIGSNDKRISVSVGIATFDGEETSEEFISRAEHASNQANKDGGNQTVISE